jgi:uncharacterized membrane protein
MTNLEAFTSNAKEALEEVNPANPDSPLSGAKGAAAGVAIAVLPIAVERVVRFAGGKASNRIGSDALSEKVSDLGGRAAGKAREATEKATPDMPKPTSGAGGMLGKLFSRGGNGGGDDSSSNGGKAAPGYGSGRRMPIQQAIDIGVPLRKVYDQWTQFEDWPEFMHRVDSVDKVDDTTVSFTTKVWGITKRFEAKITEAHPDERIEWNVEQGLSHTGVVTFHELSERLTRVLVTVDLEPEGIVEKMGRGMRYSKRAVRGDLHRLKAYVELYEDEIEKGWRGTVEDGEVKRPTQRKSSGGRSRGSKNGSSRARSGGGSRSRSGSGGSRSRSGGGGRSRSGSRGSS